LLPKWIHYPLTDDINRNHFVIVKPAAVKPVARGVLLVEVMGVTHMLLTMSDEGTPVALCLKDVFEEGG
jgi:hypothetical protein